MTYGDNKTKDIIESVLPSKRNGMKTARKDKALASRHERRPMDADLHCYRGATADVAEDIWDEGSIDPNYNNNVVKRDIVDDRRNKDNLGALLAWTEAMIRRYGEPVAWKMVHDAMPDTLQGRHALGHAKDCFTEMEEDEFRYVRRSYSRSAGKHTLTYPEMRAKLIEVIESGRHKAFNDTGLWASETLYCNHAERADLIALHPYSMSIHMFRWSIAHQAFGYKSTKHRPFLGIHDIDSFLSDVPLEYILRNLDRIGLGFSIPVYTYGVRHHPPKE